MTDATSTSDIVFPKVGTSSAEVAVAAPPAPTTVDAGLAAVATEPAKRVELSCSKLLQGETRRRAEQEAAQLYPKMLDSTPDFMSYGTAELKDVNDLVDRLLKEVGPVNIPELKKLMNNLRQEMRGIQHKYDPSDTKSAEEFYDRHVRKFTHWLHKARSVLEMMMDDIQSVDHQMEIVTKALETRQGELVRNVGYYDALYEQNEAEIMKLIYVIGVMELIRDLAAQDAESTQVGDPSLGDRGGEEKARKAEFSHNMEIKLTEFKGRLFIAWATSPQLRTMRALDVGLATRVKSLVDVTIPTMKATILQWRTQVQSGEAADLAKFTEETFNETVQAFEKGAAVTVARIAQVNDTPTLTAQSINAMAASVAEQADAIIAAMDEGAARRAEMDEAMAAAMPVIADAGKRVSDALINQVVAQATKPLEIATSVPSASN